MMRPGARRAILSDLPPDHRTSRMNDQMIKRPPHVFGEAVVEDAAAQTQAWEAQKAAERQAKGAVEGRPVGALDGVTVGLPAMTRALKLQRRAARVGFDWPAENALAEIEAKLAEEMGEIKAEIASGDKAALADECGDLLFVCVNLLRHLGVDPESALRSTNAKFERRFRAVEDRMREEGIDALALAGLNRLETAWQAVHADVRGNKASAAATL